MNKPLISIVVPVYNTCKYIDECVESIRKQIYKNINIFLIDDGSTDYSGTHCDEIAMVDSKIISIHKKNGGLSDARNVGLSILDGDYVSFVDSDDFLEESIIEKANNSLINNDCDVVVWGFSADFVQQNRVCNKQTSLSGIVDKISDNNSLLLTEESKSLLGYAWNKLYKTEIIRKFDIAFKKGVSLVEDILFNSDYLMHSNCFCFINDIGTHYMQRNLETLGNKYYESYFELKMFAIHARESIFRNFGIEEDDTKATIESDCFSAIKSTIRTLYKMSSINNESKRKECLKILNKKDIKNIISNYCPKGKNILFYIVFKYKLLFLLEILYER